MKKDFSSPMDVHLYVREQSFVHMAISGDDYDIVATYMHTPTSSYEHVELNEIFMVPFHKG